jgi:group I intron endonuclease
MKTSTQLPGVYCFWNKINNKIYVGSAQDLEVRLNQHFKNKSSNIYLQNAIKKYGLESFHISQITTETEEEARNLEQMCLNYIFAKDLPKYNIGLKSGGGKVRESYTNHGELCEQNGGFKAKHFFIKKYPSGKILLEAESTYDGKAQEFLKMGQGRISNQLTDKKSSLFIKLESGQIVYLEYLDQSLSERAELLGRSIESDCTKVLNKPGFKPTLNLKHKKGHTVFLENYATYCKAAKMLNLKTHSELSGFCAMVSGKRPSASGWSLVT